jgi:hypothetical protein
MIFTRSGLFSHVAASIVRKRRNLMWGFIGRPKLALAAMAVIVSCALAGSANAESIKKQCSEKYKAAKAANTLGGQNWNQFYKQCEAQLKGTPAPTAAPAAAPAPAPVPAPTPAPAPAAAPKKEKASPYPAPVATGPVVFPKAIDPKYASLSAGKGREKTCLDQYHANKTTNSNGGLKWIEKGGGYYSQCNKHLKGE